MAKKEDPTPKYTIEELKKLLVEFGEISFGSTTFFTYYLTREQMIDIQLWWELNHAHLAHLDIKLDEQKYFAFTVRPLSQPPYGVKS